MNTLRQFLLCAITSVVSITTVAQINLPVGPGPVPPAETITPDSRVFEIAQGKLQGGLDHGVRNFRGIPFAKAPIGDLRWRPPAQPDNWVGTKQMLTFGSSCREQEDCLFLNIYTPANVDTQSQLPVMMFIHGGGFAGGTGAIYDGSQFARNNVVLVTINYRLGRAGWFAHPALTQEASDRINANYGLMDQIAALQWIQKNIQAFGGDKNNVTIFGGSAGAISVNYLMLAPQARGIFHRAIAQSGFGRLAPLPLSGNDGMEQAGLNFAAAFSISGSDAAAAKKMRDIPFADLNKPIADTGRALPIRDGVLITSGMVEGFRAKQQAGIAYMLGGNSDEASLRRRATDAEKELAAIGSDKNIFLGIFDNKKSGDIPRTIARMITDREISEPDRALARAHAAAGFPTFIYHFSYTPVVSRATSYGLRHGGETPYVFNVPPSQGFETAGAQLAENANHYWSQFAAQGDPGEVSEVRWRPFTKGSESLMEFSDNGKASNVMNFHKARLDWVTKNIFNE